MSPPHLHVGPLLLLLFCLSPGMVMASLLIGAGSILPSRVILDAQVAYRFVQSTTQVQFYPSDSGAGKCRIMNYTAECSPTDKRAPEYIDFAIGASMFTAENYERYPDLQMYPTVVAGLVPIYNLNGSRGLALTRPVLAKIFCGQIRTWDHPDIVATNPNFTAWKVPPGQPIELVVRRESADLTVAFKRAMAAFWPDFLTYADPNATSTFGSALTTRKDGYESTNTYLIQTPWTISFTPYGYAQDFNAMQAKMVQSSGSTIECTLTSITYAVLEMGLSFGNNGDDPSRLTADLSNAQGVNAWPINTYMYLILRKSTLRKGATCATVKENSAFWQWFLTADVLSDITQKRDFVQLPTIIRDVVFQRLINDVTCNGVRVYEAANTTAIVGAGEWSLSSVFVHISRVYPLYQSNTTVTYNSLSLTSASAVQQALTTNRFVVVRQSNLQPPSGTTQVLFAGVALAVISQYNLTLDARTLVRILEGEITTWLHPDIVALNPYGMVDTGGARITAQNQTILLYNGPTTSTPTYWDLMRRLAANYTGRAIQAAQYWSTEELLRYVVSGTPYSLSVSVYSGDFSARLQFASIVNPAGVATQATATAIQACASPDVYNPVSNSFALSQSANPGCYFLSEATYLIVRKPQCGKPDPVASATVTFADWLYSVDGLDAALEDQHLSPLHAVSLAVEDANAAALLSLQCITPTEPQSSINFLPIALGACFGGFFAVVLPVAWYVWSSTKEMRRLRKQFSDVKVAQECAEAIACFNLDAVAWLSTVRNPSKIQQAFLNIIGLLVEVKPFIPDQLMAQLQAGQTADRNSCEEGEEVKLRPTGAEDALTTTTSMSTLSNYRSPKGGVRSPGRGLDGKEGKEGREAPLRRHHSRGKVSSAHSEVSSMAQPAVVMGRVNRVHPHLPVPHLQTDNSFRTCTYLFARFTLSADSAARLAPRMTAIAAHVVSVAKNHGATIDKVTYDSVAVHWNGSVSAASAPTQATELALELTKTRAILPLDAQPGFRLLVGVGHGLCHVATVSAAGQRFFVVGGPEVATAVDVVMRELAAPLGCTVLVTSAVQQEVQYAFHCFPRLWHHDTLLWEPVESRQSTTVSEEWMYEIQQMEQRDKQTYGGRLLQEVFLLARNESTRPAVLEKVRKIEATYAAEMSQQDVASLRLLVGSLGNRPER